MKVHAQFPDEQAPDGSFVRQDDVFRDCVTADGRSGYPVEAGRYHLYVSLACPWASRLVILRKLLGLEQAIGMTVVDPPGEYYGRNYYAVYFADPDGMKLEGMIWAPPAAKRKAAVKRKPATDKNKRSRKS